MKGFSNKQVADELGISEATVKAHMSSVMEKLEVPDRTRAVTVAIERGVIRLD
ncbi:LuxR C-terminal-related transcriptional regulator [Luteolibacter arcticus]|uniref:LuxR C-terminal-related transcriptional regulator n=1 Tax=Luteolibacter arcticus TaxID=1581411 RepID=A0ABT3GNC8_9BACT|nr:LuxR C-terminal-related transcriptional regulator [Luteolibacter arcticus]MCW1925026.1 LuxR C-terminal-related transcriptional regulator [Luteolibacter arcticus]